jgi:hypothetical protein
LAALAFRRKCGGWMVWAVVLVLAQKGVSDSMRRVVENVSEFDGMNP